MGETANEVDIVVKLRGVEEAKRIADEIDRHMKKVSELLEELGDTDFEPYITPSVQTSCRNGGTSSPADDK